MIQGLLFAELGTAGVSTTLTDESAGLGIEDEITITMP